MPALLRYFIPSDGDDADHPNVFHLPSDVVGSGSVRFGDVKRNFPLPGQYHFRFKRNFGDAFGACALFSLPFCAPLAYVVSVGGGAGGTPFRGLSLQFNSSTVFQVDPCDRMARGRCSVRAPSKKSCRSYGTLTLSRVSSHQTIIMLFY